jgi:hypothetical protein
MPDGRAPDSGQDLEQCTTQPRECGCGKPSLLIMVG